MKSSTTSLEPADDGPHRCTIAELRDALIEAGVPSTRKRDRKTGRYVRVFHLGKVAQQPRPKRPSYRRESRQAPVRSRGSRRGRREARAGPDDDDPHLSPRAAELARELEAASDARIETWARERREHELAGAEQLSLEVAA